MERRLWAQQEAESESDLRAAGIEVTELDEEEKARFRAAVQPVLQSVRKFRHENEKGAPDFNP